MFKLIEKLQKKPDKEKRRIAFVLCFLITLAIASLWAASLPSRFSDLEEEKAAVSGPGDALFSVVKSAFQEIKKSF